MKKILMSLFVLGLFAFSFQAHASVLSDALLKIESLTKELSQLKLQLKASVGDIVLAGTSTGDTTPRIMFWPGAVNQHVDSDGVWQTDPDGKSGGWPSTQYPNDFGGREVEYCNKFYSNITSVEAYKNETINTWYNAGNIKTSTGTRMSYKCIAEISIDPVEPSCPSNYPNPYALCKDGKIEPATKDANGCTTSYKCTNPVVPITPKITVLSPNGGETYTEGQQITVKWKTANILANVPLNLVLKGYNSNGELLMNTLLSQKIIFNDGSEVVTLPKIPTYAGVKFGKYFKIEISSEVNDSSDNYFTINSVVSKTCVPGNSLSQIKLSLTSDNPISTTFSSNVKNVNLLNVKLSNEGNQDVCLNGIQLGSSYNSNNFINKTKVIDESGIQVGKDTNFFSYNKEYYYNWVYPSSPISIPARGVKVFKIYSDVIEKATEGSFNMGVWGLNFVSPGATQYPQTVNGSVMFIKNTGSKTPSITVLSPNGGESYKAGDKMNVKWKSENIKGNIAEINLIPLDMKYGTGITLAKDISNKGSYSIELPTPSANDYYSWGNNFKIEIISGSSLANNSSSTISNLISDMSDNSFTIKSATESVMCPSDGKPFIRVDTPNGGEVYQAGQQIVVGWSRCNLPKGEDDVSIEIVRADTINDPISKMMGGGWISLSDSTPNDSYETFILDSNITPGTYQLAVKGDKFDDISDNLFTIIDPPTPSIIPTINILENVTPSITPTTTSRTLKVGVKGDDVATLQTLLGIKADGKFGPATKIKVMEWQKANNLKPDGAFGNASRLKAGL